MELELEERIKKWKDGYNNLLAEIEKDKQTIREGKERNLFLREGEVNAIENALKNVLEIEVKGDFKEKLVAIQQELEKW